MATIIGSGFGWVVPTITAACLALGDIIFGDKWTGDKLDSTGALLAAAVLTFAFDRFFLAKRADKTLMNKETGEGIIIQKNDTLLFIPVRYWPLVLVALSIAVLILG